MISTFTKLQLLMAANKYGIQINSFQEGLLEVYVKNVNLLEDSLPNLLKEVQHDPDIRNVKYNEQENVITISYNHDALTNKQTIERWISIFQQYNDKR